jgi:superfamily I DNA/RNA helicase
MGRVQELADGPVSEDAPCPLNVEGTNRRPYRSLIPLEEILGELLGVGPASKKVKAAYASLIEKAGSEFAILMDRSIGDLEKLNCPGIPGKLLAAAVDRMRKGEVSITAGYDGIYGIIRAFPQGTLVPGMVPGYQGQGTGAGFFGDEPDSLFVTSDKIPGSLSTASGAHPATPPRPSSRGSPPDNQSAIPNQDRFIPDPDQERAINHPGGPALIIAGPGTGKTAVLARSIARLMGGPNKAGVRVLALSFTNQSAEELRERINRIMGSIDAAVLTVGTFHSLGRSILKAESAQAGLRDDFTILDEEARTELLKSITAGKKPRVSAGRLGLYIEERKRFLLLPGDTSPRLGPAAEAGVQPPDPALDRLYGEYRDALLAGNTLDFDDLLAGTVRLLAARPELRAKYQERFSHIFADEYQDINFAQYTLLRLLARKEIRVIGDPNQAIYGFRGASNRYMDRFLADHPGAVVYRLNKSFRCAEPIIRAANSLTGTSLQGTSSAVAPGTDGGISLYRTPYPTDRAEAEGIARRIDALIGGTGFFAMDSGVANSNIAGLTSLGQCAILIRTAVLVPPIEEALKNHGIPYRLMGENLEDIRWSIEEVALMTIHASKGLEFDHVFVSGLEEGILPFTLFGGNKPEDIAEERRLLYVAMTRARRGLHLSWAASRSFRGRTLTLGPSRFLVGLESLIPELQHGIKRDRDRQPDLFS